MEFLTRKLRPMEFKTPEKRLIETCTLMGGKMFNGFLVSYEKAVIAGLFFIKSKKLNLLPEKNSVQFLLKTQFF